MPMDLHSHRDIRFDEAGNETSLETYVRPSGTRPVEHDLHYPRQWSPEFGTMLVFSDRGRKTPLPLPR